MRLFMLGAGGHARSVADALAGTTIECVVVPEVDDGGSNGLAATAISEAELLAMDPTGLLLVNGIGQVAAGGARWGAYQRFIDGGFEFRSVIHSAATVSKRAQLGHGVQVLAGAVIGPGAAIGANSLINTGSIVEHDCTIGQGVHIAPGAVVCGDVTVGEDSIVGAGATVVPGITIGAGAQLGAGAVLLEDVPNGQVFVGVPARRTR